MFVALATAVPGRAPCGTVCDGSAAAGAVGDVLAPEYATALDNVDPCARFFDCCCCCCCCWSCAYCCRNKAAAAAWLPAAPAPAPGREARPPAEATIVDRPDCGCCCCWVEAGVPILCDRRPPALGEAARSGAVVSGNPEDRPESSCWKNCCCRCVMDGGIVFPDPGVVGAPCGSNGGAACADGCRPEPGTAEAEGKVEEESIAELAIPGGCCCCCWGTAESGRCCGVCMGAMARERVREGDCACENKGSVGEE